jgi:hypothetical protein
MMPARDAAAMDRKVSSIDDRQTRFHKNVHWHGAQRAS